jgi:SAM-dependent methyltransferase
LLASQPWQHGCQRAGNEVTQVSWSANATQAERWNGESGRYWIAHRERHLAGHQHLIPHLFAAAAISPGECVLDVGCGCGATTITAARAARGRLEAGSGARRPADGGQGAGGHAVGLDLSGPMLAVARRLAAQAGVANAGFVRGDAQVRPLRPESFDVVISSFGVMFFEDPAAAFASIAGGLRSGGRLALLCWRDDLLNELFAIPLRAFRDIGQLPAPADAGGDLFAAPARIADLLSRTGWADVHIEAVSEPAWMGSNVDDVMSYVRGMTMTRRLAARLGDESLTEQVLAGMAEQYGARQQPDGVWVQAAAWQVTARRAGPRA